MSLIEGASDAATTAERHDEPSQRLRAVIRICIMAVGVVGVGAVTLGWTALVARAVVWLAWG
jgi:hypothetical protein